MLIGDLPIFVAHDSADVWANPELFYLDKTWSAAGGRRRSAGLFQRDRPALGQPALSVGGPRRGRLSMVGRPAPFPAGPGRHRPDRSFSRLRGVLGDPGRVADGRIGPVGRGTGEPVFRGAAPDGSATSRLIAEDLGVITPGVRGAPR